MSSSYGRRRTGEGGGRRRVLCRDGRRGRGGEKRLIEGRVYNLSAYYKAVGNTA